MVVSRILLFLAVKIHYCEYWFISSNILHSHITVTLCTFTCVDTAGSQNEGDDSDSNTAAAVAGTIVPLIVIIILVICLVLLLLWYRKRRERKHINGLGSYIHSYVCVHVYTVYICMYMHIYTHI